MSDRPSFRSRVFLDGAARECRGGTFLASALLGRKAPSGDELPYVFCGNGACRDCCLLVEGLDDVPSCRVPIAAGLSLRSGEGGGEPNALSRRLPRPTRGEPLVAEVAIVGAGTSGAEAFEASRAEGRETLWLDARDLARRGLRPRRPVGVVEGEPFVFELGRARPLRSRKLVLATGGRDRFPAFPGSTLPGVLPLDLLERYVELGTLPGRRFVLVGEADRVRPLGARLVGLGAENVRALEEPRRLVGATGRFRLEAVRLASGEAIEADALGVSLGREPSLSLARALGCRTRYDRAARAEVVDVDERGASSVEGVFVPRGKC